MRNKRIIIGSDAFGYPLKQVLVQHLIDLGYQVDDIGVNENENNLYPEIAKQLCQTLQNDNEYNRGILVCGTGAGMAIVANKMKGISAVCIHDPYTAERARASNNAQIATFGSQVIGANSAKKLLDIWLNSEFSGGRSLPKVKLIEELDKNIHNV